LGLDILVVDHQRASRPRESCLHRIDNVAGTENLRGADNETALSCAPRALHLLRSDQQLYAAIALEILLSLSIVPDGKNEPVILDIPRSRHNPKILWVDDAEVVGDGVAEAVPVLGDFVAQEIERDIRELCARGVAFVVRDVLVHDPP
jgi:hypothetical protein